MRDRRIIVSRRILVYRIGQLGDTIIALPAIWAVRKHFPEAHMALLSDVHDNGGYVLARSVFPPEGLFDQWLTYQAQSGGTSPRGMGRLLFKLRENKFDTLIYLAPRRRTPFQVRRDLVFFRSAGIRTFIGRHGFDPLPEKVSGQPLPFLQHEADHLLHRLSLDGIPVPSSGQGEMSLGLTDAERSEARNWLSGQCADALDRGRMAGIGPGSKWPSKVWPAERFEELGRRMIKDLGLFPVVFGGPEDAGLASHLIDRWGQGANAAGALAIRQAAGALEQCRFYVGNDTGTTHLAAAVGTPCVAVFSAQDYPGRWYPYGNGHMVLREPVSCEGCGLTTCNQDKKCLLEISVEKAMFACNSMMESIPNWRTHTS